MEWRIIEIFKIIKPKLVCSYRRRNCSRNKWISSGWCHWPLKFLRHKKHGRLRTPIPVGRIKYIHVPHYTQTTQLYLTNLHSLPCTASMSLASGEPSTSQGSKTNWLNPSICRHNTNSVAVLQQSVVSATIQDNTVGGRCLINIGWHSVVTWSVVLRRRAGRLN